MSKKFLFLDYSGNDLAFAEICNAQQNKFFIVDNSNDLKNYLDKEDYDAVFLDLDKSDKFDFKDLKMPETVFIHADDKAQVDVLVKQILFSNPEFRLVVHTFEPGISSSFANLVKSI
jgi:hypothetical protein